MIIRNRDFDFESDIYIMGILNVTPDSFSDGGKHNSLEDAVRMAKTMLEDGADIIDIGGESTRPGFEYVSETEELARVIPVIKRLREECPDVVISIDTTKSEVAKSAICAGADIINDVSGFLLDENMVIVAKELDVPCILMHDGNYFMSEIEKAGDGAKECDEQYMNRLVSELDIICKKAVDAGIRRENIIVDPGVGFGKTLNQNLTIIRELDELEDLEYPILLGCSRKSVIGKSLDLPVDERVEGTITTSIIGAMNGACILRVHDVKENTRAVKMLKAIYGI